MFRIIPHIYKSKLGQGLYFPFKYSDLESHFLAEIDKEVHLDVWFQANHSHWMTKRSRIWRDKDYTLISLTYNPRDRFRSWPDLPLANSIVVRCRIYALPIELAKDVGLTRSELRKAVAGALNKIAAGGLFNRRWQVTARLRIRERLLECVSLSWKHTTPITLANQLVDLSEEKQLDI
jgi:hypothetical protein